MDGYRIESTKRKGTSVRRNSNILYVLILEGTPFVLSLRLNSRRYSFCFVYLKYMRVVGLFS